jgi:hypothetical protein
MRRLWLVLLAAAATRASGSELEVRIVDGRVQLKAVAAPVSQILDRLAQQTGMKVIYDGAPPRQVVSPTLTDVTPAAAVVAVLQGLGLNYAMMLDPTGTKVQTLMMIAPSAGAAPPVSARPAPAMPTPPPELAEPSEDKEEVEEAPVPSREDPRRRGMPGMPPPVAPGVLPPGPTFMPGQPFTITPMPLQPPTPGPSPTPQ